MIYVFDSSTLIHLFRYYYLQRFPTLWGKFDGMAKNSEIVSVREVYSEIKGKGDRLSDWAKKHREFFMESSLEEINFVSEIFKISHFQMLIRQQARLQGNPVADPFVIAKAKIISGCVITQEVRKTNAAKIPNVCDHFEIPCYNLEEFMEMENWKF